MSKEEVTVKTFVPLKKEAPSFTKLTNLASNRLGAKTLGCSDDFFAEVSNILKPEPPIFKPDAYTDRGKWMDGWESRRNRSGKNDFCIIKLGTAGEIHGVDIDTTFFTGNHPAYASIDGIVAEADATFEDLKEKGEWKQILSKKPLDPGTNNFFEIESRGTYWTHVRLQIYPDGGVARFRVYGYPKPISPNQKDVVDLVSILNGGRVLDCSNQYFSRVDNIILPDEAINMGDGWETKRRRGPGFDWIILKVGCPAALIKKINIGTHHFKGNYPESFSLDICYNEEEIGVAYDVDWIRVIDNVKMRAHEALEIEIDEKFTKIPFNLIRLCIYPDGGISRLRVYGVPTEPPK